MRRYLLGVDGGGTKTAAILLDVDSPRVTEIGRVIGGPSNFQSAGTAVAEESLRDVIHRALFQAGIAADDVLAIGLGMAGVYRPGDRETVEAIVTRIGDFPRVVVTNDAEAALVGGVGRRHGVVLIAGTGALAYGVNARGDTRRADGWGYIIGDEGSAYWIGAKALRAVARAYDGRGPETALTETILTELGLNDAMFLVRRVYSEMFSVSKMAGLARLVSLEASKGDRVAVDILTEAGQRLSDSVLAVILGLGMVEEEFPLVLTGGVVSSKGIVRAAVISGVKAMAPLARAMDPEHDAAYGAALLAGLEGE
jgi:N-acetylglucosamine kinase-like BadF-type ATPase